MAVVYAVNKFRSLDGYPSNNSHRSLRFEVPATKVGGQAKAHQMGAATTRI